MFRFFRFLFFQIPFFRLLRALRIGCLLFFGSAGRIRFLLGFFLRLLLGRGPDQPAKRFLSAPTHQNKHKHGDHKHQAEQLGNADAAGKPGDRIRLHQPEAVSAQPFHEHAFKPIQARIAEQRVAIVLKLFAQEPEHKEHQQTPNGFIKECGKMQMHTVRAGDARSADRIVEVMRSFNADGKREILQRRELGDHLCGNGQAKGLLIKEIPPPADRLRQHKPRRDAIRKLEKAHLAHTRKNKRAQETEDHRAVNGKAAFPDV